MQAVLTLSHIVIMMMDSYLKVVFFCYYMYDWMV